MRRKWGRWSHSYPMVMPALCAIAGVGLADGGVGYAWAVLFLLGLAWSFYSRRWVWLLSLCCGFAAAGLHFKQLADQATMQQSAGEMWSGQAVVQQTAKYGRVTLQPQEGEFAGKRIVAMLPYGRADLLPGDIVAASGRLERPELGMNPGQFDQRAWLHREGVELILGDLQISEADGWESGYVLRRMAVLARDHIRKVLVRGLNRENEGGKVMLAMYLGDRPEEAQDLVDDFKMSGTIHVFAVSGLHVMMIGGLVGFVLRISGLSRRVWIPLCVASMFFYALVTGLNPPALRAAIMGTIFLGGWLVGRKATLGNSLAVGCLIALWMDGHVLFQPGFQLSFAVLLAIAIFNSWWSRCLGWINYMDPFLPRPLYTEVQEWVLGIRKWLKDGLSVGSSAWCGSLPFLLWHFGVVTPISIVASLPLVLLVFCVLSLSCLSLVVGGITENANVWVNRACSRVAVMAHQCAHSFAQVPGGNFVHRPWLEGERVVVFAVSGGGGCSYLGLAGGVLIDTAGGRSFSREVAPCLQSHGAAVDSVILSHADAGHCGGMVEVLESYPLKQVLLPEENAQSVRYKEVLNGLKQKQVDALLATQGMKLPLSGNSYCEVLWAPEWGRKGWADDRCLVIRLHWRGFKILFMNDAGYQVEQWLDQQGVDLSADVLVAGKHRTDLSLSDDFLMRVKPKAVVLSSAQFPDGEWRSKEWQDQLRQSGVAVFSQERCGAMMMEINESGELELRGHLEGSLNIPAR